MSEGLTFNGDVVVKFGTTTIYDASAQSGNKGTYTAKTNGFDWTIDMTTQQAYVNQPITVTYTATVNSSAITRDKENNTATLTYSNDPNDSTSTETTPPEIVTVYSLNVDITKVDSENNSTKLSGASFVLYEERTELSDPSDPNSDPVTVKYYYVQDSTTKAVSWATTKANATVLTTPASGEVTFEGLDLNDANGTTGNYFIEETVAPRGYNLPANPFPVVITKNVNATTGAVTFTATVNTVSATVDSSDQTVAANIENTKGALLPETGGIGTSLFYLIGAILILGAAVLILSKRRLGVKA